MGSENEEFAQLLLQVEPSELNREDIVKVDNALILVRQEAAESVASDYSSDYSSDYGM